MFEELTDKAKYFPLTRAVISISYPSDGPESPFVAIVYHAKLTIKESTQVLTHGNTTKDSFLTKPYISFREDKTDGKRWCKTKNHIRYGQQHDKKDFMIKKMS